MNSEEERAVQRPAEDGQDLGAAVQREVAQMIRPIVSDLQREIHDAVRQQIEQSAEASEPVDDAEAGHGAGANRQETPPPEDRSGVHDEGERGGHEPQRGAGGLLGGVRAVQSSIDIAQDMTKTPVDKMATAAVDRILEAVFSPTVRQGILTQSEIALRGLVQEAIDALPGDSVGNEVRRQADETIRTIVEETLDDLFDGPTRAEIQAQVEWAAQAFVAGDSEEARQKLTDAFESMFTTFLRTLQSQSGQVFRLLFRLTVEGLEGTVTSAAKERVVDESQQKVESTAGAVQEKVRDKAEEGRRKMAEAVEHLQRRLRESAPSASGRSGGPAGGRPERGRPNPPPLSRPPSGRPPSGLPPSVQRRRA